MTCTISARDMATNSDCAVIIKEEVVDQSIHIHEDGNLKQPSMSNLNSLAPFPWAVQTNTDDSVVCIVCKEAGSRDHEVKMAGSISLLYIFY